MNIITFYAVYSLFPDTTLGLHESIRQLNGPKKAMLKWAGRGWPMIHSSDLYFRLFRMADMVPGTRYLGDNICRTDMLVASPIKKDKHTIHTFFMFHCDHLPFKLYFETRDEVMHAVCFSLSYLVSCYITNPLLPDKAKDILLSLS